MNDQDNKLELKRYLKEREYELNTIIIDKVSKKEDPSVEIKLIGEIQIIINICERRNRY